MQRWLQRSSVALMVMAASLATAAGDAYAERPLIDIEGAYFRPFPIAVPDLKARAAGDSELARELAAVLRNDLALTGLFQVLDPRSFIAPQQEGVTVGTIAFPAWLNVGADGLVKGLLSQSGSNLTVELHVFDVVRGRETLRETLRSDGQPRRLAHRLADLLIKHYTGETGVFLSRIAFAQRRGRVKDICVMDVDGHNVDCVVRNGSLNLLPAWDGIAALLFTSYLGGSTDLYRARLQGGKAQVLSSQPGLNAGAAVAPDGKRVALTLSRDGNSEVYLMGSDGKQLRRLTHEPWAIDSSPSWSPDGKQLAFVSDRQGTPQIWVMNADGASQRRLTYQGNYNQTPAWSPRGDRIAFTARDERNVFDLFIVEVGSGRIIRVTQDQGNNEEPTWAPNGRMLAFISDRQGDKAIFVSDAEGKNQQRVSRGRAPCYTPAWSAQMPTLK